MTILLLLFSRIPSAEDIRQARAPYFAGIVP